MQCQFRRTPAFTSGPMIRRTVFVYVPNTSANVLRLPGSTGAVWRRSLVLKLRKSCADSEYSDCCRRCRSVLANAQMVVRKGGGSTRTRATAARREMACGLSKREDIDTGKKYVWQARGLVNATGTAGRVLFDEGMHPPSPYGIPPSDQSGSHIVAKPRVRQSEAA